MAASKNYQAQFCCKNQVILNVFRVCRKPGGMVVINMVAVKTSLAPFCCVLVKDGLRPFTLLGVLGKQFFILVISL